MSARERAALKPKRFGRRWWAEGVHQFFWVALVTLLVWIYADMQFTDASQLTVSMTLTTGNSQKMVLMSPANYTFRVELAGSQASLEDLRGDLAERDFALTFNVAQAYPVGEQIVQAQDLLNRAMYLRDRGVTIQQVDPQAIALQLDTLVEIPNVPVVLETTGASLADPPAPQQVNVLVPSSRWEELSRRLGDQRAQLKTRLVDLAGYEPGRTVDLAAEIIPVIEGVDVRLPRTTARYRVTILNPEAAEDILVPVQILAPPTWAENGESTWGEYVLVRQSQQDWRPRLRIAGPKTQLQPGNVTAYLRLTEDDKKPTESWLSREVEVRFPPGTNLKLQGPAPQVRFRLERRQPTPAGT